MTIIYITKTFPEARGVKWIKSLTNLSKQVIVFTERYKEEFNNWDYNVEIIKLEEITFNNNFNKIVNYIRENNISPDTIIIRDIFQTNLVTKLKKEYNCTLISDIADNYPEVAYQLKPNIVGKLLECVLNKKEKKLINNSDLLITVTDESEKYIKNKHRSNKGSIVIRNLPYKEEIPDKTVKLIDENPNNKINMVYIGSYTDGIRDLKFVFDCMIDDENLYLEIYSFNADRITRILNTFNEQLKLRVKFKNLIHSSEMEDILSTYDIGLIPHSWGFGTNYTEPNKLYDYIHSGLPILCSDNPAMSKTVEFFNVGYSYKNNNKKDFIEKIYLLKNKKLSIIANQLSVRKKLHWEFELEEKGFNEFIRRKY